MEGVKVLQQLKNSININAAQLGKIVEYNENSRLSTIQPLVMVNEETQPLLISVPVSKEIIEPKVGDMVLVVFLDYDSDAALISNQISNPTSKRTHDLSDAVVVASFNPLSGVI